MPMPEYTVAALLSVVAVLAYELGWARTGLLRSRAYWATMSIVFGFQCLVDGWLTRADRPIVRYDPDQITNIRIPWNVPIEDFLFGFALLTLVLVRWQLAARPIPADSPR
jgi:lycopene cyclase domain-containing protein